MKILVTGSRGFVGKETVKLLEKEGHEVIHFDLIDGHDIREYEDLKWMIVLHNPDRILHLAAIARFAEADKDPKLAFETNVIGTKNVAKVAEAYKIPVVYASTGSVYMPISEEPPITEEFKTAGNSVYGCTKLMGEKYIQGIDSYYIILRYAHLMGVEKRFHGLVGGYISRIQRGMEPVLFGGAQSNDFCAIEDIAQANVLALTASPDSWRQVYNIGTGEELSAKKAGDIVCEVFNYTGGIEQQEQRTVDASRFVYDISKAKNMLGYKPKYTFRDSIIQIKKQVDAETKRKKSL
jgi:UDP-glucose 4-epimerase